MRITPTFITKLKPDEVFVFGSNLGGKHGAGAAAFAYRKFGARWGVGEGISGQSYALPTCDKDFSPLATAKIARHVEKFLQYARSREDKTFWVTPVGCGLAGYKPTRIAPLFWSQEIPEHVILPAEFHQARWPRIKQLRVAERVPFRQWLTGQTMPLIDGVAMDEQDAYYPWDYERWKQGLPIID